MSVPVNASAFVASSTAPLSAAVADRKTSMVQAAVATFRSTADSPAWSVTLPVVLSGTRVRVSVVIAMVRTLIWLTKMTSVPTGKATAALAGIVNVRALLSAVGWRSCLPTS